MTVCGLLVLSDRKDGSGAQKQRKEVGMKR